MHLLDPAVVRALAGRLREPLDASERGFWLETSILHELRASMASQDTDILVTNTAHLAPFDREATKAGTPFTRPSF